jgi:hypothetical protein
VGTFTTCSLTLLPEWKLFLGVRPDGHEGKHAQERELEEAGAKEVRVRLIKGRRKSAGSASREFPCRDIASSQFDAEGSLPPLRVVWGAPLSR